MGKTLIIVESPTKIKTLKKFLGKDYVLESSVGHIRDLPKKGFGIDLDNDFEPLYETLPEKKDVVAKLKKAAKACDNIYLAPDPDREGEAIAWHIAAILPKTAQVKRITFNAITKNAVLEAINNPRAIYQSLVDAQQARRLLDRIVGYKISPILYRRIKRGKDGGLSAGRVQSIALKFVVDREKEIEAFTPVEYWNINALLHTDSSKNPFSAYLYSVNGKKVEKEEIKGKDIYTISNEVQANNIVTQLNSATYTVASVDKKEKKRNPVPPFITSTLQQEANRHYGYGASRTMGIAQSLYEGVDMGSEGGEGLITYMRTDSVRIEPEALNAARKFIESKYGKKYLPEKTRYFTTKKSAQDAHEAIRPTNISNPPEKVKQFLAEDQYKIYDLIWKRFISSQMNPALYDTVSCDLTTDKDMILRTTGSIIKFKGFLAVYQEKEDSENNEPIDKPLTNLKTGQSLTLQEITSMQSFTKPPARFTEASLVKELEKSGIGRPSTYAAIMNKIQSRTYTTKERLYIKPTELGNIIASMLETHFSIIMNVQFTANMESELDEIANSNMNWKAFIKEFWEQFLPVIQVAEKEAHVPKILTQIDCPKCGSKLQKIWSCNKYFYGCSNYPDCKFTVPIEALEFQKEDYSEGFNWDQNCPKCTSPMNIRYGRFGAFLGCNQYPDCNGIINIPKKGEPLPEDRPNCVAIGCNGKIQQRRSRFGKIFYSCSNYPDCDVIINELEKLPEKYPNHPKTAYIKKSKGKPAAKRKKETAKKGTKKKSTRQMPSYPLSPELAEIVEEKEMTRGNVTKKLWEYIKANNLQDPKNKRLIIPDAKLAKVFGNSDPVDMMKLAGLLTRHFIKK